MRDMDLEHPDITAAIRTGYPRRSTTRYYSCDGCGESLSECAWFIDIGGCRYCDSCTEDMRKEPGDAVFEIDEEPEWFDERRRLLYG